MWLLLQCASVNVYVGAFMRDSHRHWPRRDAPFLHVPIAQERRYNNRAFSSWTTMDASSQRRLPKAVRDPSHMSFRKGRCVVSYGSIYIYQCTYSQVARSHHRLAEMARGFRSGSPPGNSALFPQERNSAKITVKTSVFFFFIFFFSGLFWSAFFPHLFTN